MSPHWSTFRRHDEEPVASATMSRLIVLLFVVAILLGATTGLLWIGWNLLKRALGG